MKLNINLFMMLIAGILTFTGCSNDDDKINGNLPNKQVVEAFKKQFPNATDVEWSTRNGYSVASFYLSQKRAVAQKNFAWYETNGECALSELEIDNFDLLPQAVKDGYNTTVYAKEGWEIDDIDALSRQGMALVYKIEVEKEGQPDHDLLFSVDGFLISDKIDNDDDDDNVPVVIPGAISDFIHKHIDGAIIQDLDKEDGYWEIEISFNGKQYDLFFEASFKFNRVEEEDFPEVDLPEAVKTALAEYTAAWEIDEITLVTYADKSVSYKIELENDSTDEEITLNYKADGSLIQ
ncbi:MAG: PepSY-like domain-containing protein [Bacteroidales bacterium]